MYKFRLMKETDIPAVVAIQDESYSPASIEPEPTIRSRLRRTSDTAWVAEDGMGVCAYLVGYRSVVGKVTPLHADFRAEKDADCLYLHDLAVARRANGKGIGPALVGLALDQGMRAGLAYSALVSVQDSKDFWMKLGYREESEREESALMTAQAANLETYDGPAFYMVKVLQSSS